MSELIDLPPERRMPEARKLARQERIEQYTTRPSRRPWITRNTTRFAIIASGASALLIGGTAAAYVAFRPAGVPIADQTRCYTKASLEGGDRNFFGTTVTLGRSADGTRTATSAVELCSALWRQGLLQLGSKQVGGPDAGQTSHPVPPLVACTLDNGVAAVFPGDDQTCARLGLPRLAD
jgi:hypothetical protein